MREHGFDDARLTGRAADGGIDIVSRGGLAQVKYRASTTGRPDIQRLLGAAAHRSNQELLFFSLGKYSKPAEEFAAQHGIALFRMCGTAKIVPANGTARSITRRPTLSTVREDSASVGASPGKASLAVPPGESMSVAERLRKEEESRQRQRKREETSRRWQHYRNTTPARMRFIHHIARAIFYPMMLLAWPAIFIFFLSLLGFLLHDLRQGFGITFGRISSLALCVFVVLLALIGHSLDERWLSGDGPIIPEEPDEIHG